MLQALDNPNREWGNKTWWDLGKACYDDGNYGEALEAWLMVRLELLDAENEQNVKNDKKTACNALDRQGKRARIVEAYQNAVRALNKLGRTAQAGQVDQEGGWWY